MTAPRRVVAIGGGHGLAMALRAIQTYASHVVAIVATGDDGGSSGRLRAELAIPAPGDLRRCLTSVASDATVAAAFEHRIRAGELAGHPVGNLMLAGLLDAGLDLVAAADTMSGWLGIDASTTRILPATSEAVGLVATTDAGVVGGQVAIEATPDVRAIGTEPIDPDVPIEATEALTAADQIVLAPGSFHTSIVATAALPAIRAAIDATSAPVVFVANLAAGDQDVRGFDVARHVQVLAEHGVRVDAVVAQRGALAIGDLGSTRLVVADVVRPHGLAHDAGLLGAVLAAT